MSQHDNSLIKTPRQLIIVIVLAFLVPVILISLLATYVVRSTTSGGSGSDAMGEKAIAERMRPVGLVAFADSSGPKSLQTGEAVYAAACSACHATGVAGAPRVGDTASWAPRIKQGFDLLVKHAVEGFKAMPPKGGNSNLDSVEVARAVAFMGNQSGAKFKEPAAPAGTAATVAATPAVAPAAAATAAATPASTPTAAKGAAVTAKADGAKVYASGCNVCHAAGVAGAPKFGDKAAWAPRIGQGVDALTTSVIKGKGAMPPRGAVPNVTDGEVRAAVEHMVAAAK